MGRFRGRAMLAAALVLCVALVAPARGAGATFYVDGKLGNDANDGLTPGSAFKTISRAAAMIPTGSQAAGWTVVVQGYADYVYRERPISPGWDRAGTSVAPIVFRAAGYQPGSTGSYVKPVVDGADRAPAAGKSWQPSSVAGVWRTPWPSTPFGFGKSSPSSALKTALFQDSTKWLWEQTSLSALADRATGKTGGYWYDAAAGYLYVSALTSTGDPSGHTTDVVMRNAFYFDGRHGVRYVQVRGFAVKHSANGIAFAFGTDYGTAADNVVNANLYMGVSSVGYQTPSGPDPAVGNVIWRNRGSYNTIQMIKLAQGTQNASVCHNQANKNGLQGIKVEGPLSGSTYTGATADVAVCRNLLSAQTYNPTGSAYNNASGLTIANGALRVTVSDNQIWGNDVGILVTQEASNQAPIDGLKLSRNLIWGNRRFGLYFLDGLRGSGSGQATSSYDLCWGNGIGVMVDRGVSNKSLVHDTIHGNSTEGIKIGGYQVAPSSLSVKKSLITNNARYGVWLVTGNTASISYTGLRGNAGGNIVGTPALASVNFKAAGYLSTSSASSDFLRISPSSYQYTAGPNGTPIGARY